MKRKGRIKAALLTVCIIAALSTALSVFLLVKDNNKTAIRVDVPPEESSPVESLPPKPKYDSTPVKIQMAGDILLHMNRTLGPATKTGDKKWEFKPCFEEIKGYLDGDLKIVNMEAPVDAYGGNEKISGYPMFNAPIEILDGIKHLGFNLVTTANNHAFDHGFDGIVNTRKNLTAAGLDHVGTYENTEQHDAYYIKEINGIKVGVLAYSDSDNGNFMTKERREFVMKMFKSTTLDDLPKMISDMEKCKAAGAEYIIFSLHWGDEYNDKPDVGARKQREIANGLIAAGADIIMGNHAHTVQPIEKKKVTVDGKEKTGIIIYALGNFFADQTGLKDSRVGESRKTHESMIVSVTIARNTDTGDIEYKDANYLPTRTMYYNKDGKKAYMIIPVGKFALYDEVPVYCNADSGDFGRVKNAWDRITRVVGDEITPVRG